jgi:hypothetical protein
MPTVSEMASDEASVTINIGNRPINIVYFPNKITRKACTIMSEGLDGVNQTLSEVVKSWDLLNDDDTMYPLDVDSLERLGIGLIKKVAWAIVDDTSPN